MGLGNPGPRYAANRHNAGFMVLDLLARGPGCAPWHPGPGLQSTTLVLPAPAPGGAPLQVALLKPMTMMNRSGAALAAWIAEAGGAPACGALLVVCDDLNLPLGSLRLRPGGGSGGQNGLADILQVLGTEDVPRLRLGIAPHDGSLAPADWADFVLMDFAPPEAEAAGRMVARAAEAVLCWAGQGVEAAAGRFNVRAGPAAEPAGDGAAGDA